MLYNPQNCFTDIEHKQIPKIDNNLFAARYPLYLPNKAELQEQLNQLMAK